MQQVLVARRNVKVVLAEPNAVLRQAFREILESACCEVVGESMDGTEALALVDAQNPDVVVMDINTPTLNGFEMAREVSSRGLATRVVALAIFKDDITVLEAFRAGIRAFVNKAQVATDLLPALRRVREGKYFLSPAISGLAMKTAPQQRPDSEALTPAELAILKLVVQDSSAAAIGLKLGLSQPSVESHRLNIMRKLHASNVGSLIRHALRHSAVS
jgi:DNA-binding NarL/FixJ family response regulator